MNAMISTREPHGPQPTAGRGSGRTSLTLILPAYNEEENIENSVRHSHAVLSRCFSAFEIIVVDDGSADATPAILDRLASELPTLVAVHHPHNRGYGAALRSGIDRATHSLIFFTDSDLQFDLEEIPLLLEWIEQFDIVAGYRAHRADPWHRILFAWGWNRLVRMLLGLRVRDIDCAFKLFRREVFESIHLETVGAMINTEILALATALGMAIKEVPVNHYPRTAGKQTGADLRVIVKAFRELLAMREKLRLSRRVAS